MDRGTTKCCAVLVACVAILALSACAGSPLAPAGTNTAPANAPVYNAWTTPAPAGAVYAARPAQAGALQPAPRAVGGQPIAAQPIAAQPAEARPRVWTGAGTPPPPPLPGQPVVAAAPGQPVVACEPAPCPAPVATTRRFVTPERTYAGCWPPCNQGISQWHARAVVGRALFEGTDPADDCTYLGLDLGRTFCGCWGLDLYYRYNSGRFDRTPTPATPFKDGGEWHHFGVKITGEKSFGRSSKFYAWGGLGGGYFTTSKYISNDSGPEVFGELGLGYNLSLNWRVRAGVNVHGMDTSVTRNLPINDGRSRWLWIIAPVIEIEGSF